MNTRSRSRSGVFFAALSLLFGIVCVRRFTSANPLYDEPWRPQYHFTPPKNFMNDPNGLVFYKGQYHLFFQHNPQGPQWGHMSWGHAVSNDMLHWRHLPLAIPEEPAFMIFSGSTVVDWRNSSGLCAGAANSKDPSCLAAIYTAAAKDKQSQNLAISNDRGRTWINYSGNPVVDFHQPDFRDPKVFWYEPQKKWVMVAVFADEKQLKILDSRDLKSWKLQSYFGPIDEGKGQWECPDLFELPLDGTKTKTKWVLVINRNPGAPAGGTGTQYFVGNFDGTKFVNETSTDRELWADYGKDFYATNSFSDIPSQDGRRIWMGWISNWQYANAEPTQLWRGAQSLPRSLQLRTLPDGIRLGQTPIREIASLRSQELVRLGRTSIAEAKKSVALAGIRDTLVEIEAEISPGRTGEIGFRLRKGPGEETLVGISAANHELFVDRTRSGQVSFSPEFPGVHRAKLRWVSPLGLQIFLDRSSVEVFANGGETVLTDRIYPSPESVGIEVYSRAAAGTRLESLKIWKLRSIWH